MKVLKAKRFLCLMLSLSMLLPLLPAALAEEPVVYDNSDLGADYAGSQVYLGCEEYIPDDEEPLDLGLTDEYGSPVPLPATSVLKYLGKFAGEGIGSYLMGKGLDQIWGMAFGDDTSKKLDQIIKKLDEINAKLDKILDQIKEKEYRDYINSRLKDRIRMNTEVQKTLGNMREADKKYKAGKIDAKQRYALRVAYLKEWYNKGFNGSSSGFTATIAFARYAMQMKVRDRSYLGMIDDYAYGHYPFEHLGYEIRVRERAAELSCYGYAAALSAMALQVIESSTPAEQAQQTENQKLLIKTTEEFYQYFEKNPIVFHNDAVIFQMKGMQKLALKKTQIHCWVAEDFQFGKTCRYNLDKFMYHDMRTSLIKGWIFENLMDFFKDHDGVGVLAIMGLEPDHSLVVSGEWEVFNDGRLRFKLDGRGFWLVDRSTREQLYIKAKVYVSKHTRGKLADNPNTTEWAQAPRNNTCSFELYRLKSGELVPVSEYGLPEGMVEPEPEIRKLSGVVMHIDPDDGTAYVLSDLANGDGTVETVAYEMDMSAVAPDVPLVNGMNMDIVFIRNPDNSEGQAQFVASACDMPDPVSVSGTVSLADEHMLMIIGEDGAEHAFVLPDTLALPETPVVGGSVTVTYVPVTPVKDWLADVYDGSDEDAGMIPDADAPTEYVLDVALGEEAVGEMLDGVVSALMAEYLIVLDDAGAEHAFLLTEQSQVDEGVAEGERVRVSYHIAKEPTSLGNELPVADGVALMISPIDPDDDVEDLDGVITDVDETTLQVLGEDNEAYAFTLEGAQIVGEPAVGNNVHVTYRVSTAGLEAETVTCFAPDDDQDDDIHIEDDVSPTDDAQEEAADFPAADS